MGGPWRAAGFNAAAWRPPAPRMDGSAPANGSDAKHDYLTGIVIGYLASVLTSVAIVLTLLKNGW